MSALTFAYTHEPTLRTDTSHLSISGSTQREFACSVCDPSGYSCTSGVCVCLICLYRTLCLHINECVCECACKISACHGFTNVFVCTSASLNARTQCMNQYADGRLRSTLHKRTSTQRSREATRMPITMFVATIPNHTLRYVRSYTANRCLGALDLAFVCANRALCRWAGVKASRMLKVGIISSACTLDCVNFRLYINKAIHRLCTIRPGPEPKFGPLWVQRL